MRGERLLGELKDSGELTSPRTRKVIEKLTAMGADAIPLVLKALPGADKRETLALAEVLGALAVPKLLPAILEGLADDDPRTVAAVTRALAGARGYAPGVLLEALKNPQYSAPALLEIIAAQKARVPVRDLLNAAYGPGSGDKATLFKIIGEVADENALPELLPRLEGKDLPSRVHLIGILAKLGTREVQHALLGQLKDPNRVIRQTALAALAQTDPLASVEAVAPLLDDPDMEVANRAIELMIRARDPETVRYLLPILKSESEYARRAAVEVLNEVGDAASVKYLLDAIKDSDWWVRSRAADALGKIGGPRVVDAVLELVRDKDENVRRTAIEILNLTKDERAVDYLLQATGDADWWVSERAVDALGDIGSTRAVPRLIELLSGPARAVPAAVRALGKIGGDESVDPLLQQLSRPETEIRVEAITSLTRIASERTADGIRTRVRALSTPTTDPAVADAAGRALEYLDGRFAPAGTAGTAGNRRIAAAGAGSRTMLESTNVHDLVVQNEKAPQRLDISTLSPGDILDGRYRYIDRIGKGAFGSVLLMEDAVVGERLILKFLNPSVSTDEEMMQRFVHELRYSRKITHPNVIRIYDFLFIRGNYAISMEYFPSHTLGAEIVDEKPLPIRKAVGWGCDIASGMTVAHEVGIIHRDLKPANVLINDQGLLKVVDFGVAAAQRDGEAQLTRTGYVIGSPKYMAPEQILGKQVDPRADIYSTGVILYEMLTGIPPYSRGDHMAIMYQHVQGKARPPIEVNPALPPALSDLIVKAMAVDKTKRFQTMDELRAALSAFT
jgi:serine/threonine-protein kinase